MSTRLCLLWAYRCFLQLYPRRSENVLRLRCWSWQKQPKLGNGPLIFGDTSVAIVRCWLQPAGTSSTVVPAGQNAYLVLGESELTAWRLLQGLVLSTAIIVGLCYAGSLGNPELPKCHSIAAENVSR